MKKAIYFVKDRQGMKKFICLSFGIALLGIPSHYCAAMDGLTDDELLAYQLQLQEIDNARQQNGQTSNEQMSDDDFAYRLQLQEIENERRQREADRQEETASGLNHINTNGQASDNEFDHQLRESVLADQMPIPAPALPRQGLVNEHPNIGDAEFERQTQDALIASQIQSDEEAEFERQLQEAMRISRLPNEHQSDIQIRQDQNQEYAAVLAQQQAADLADEQRRQEMNALLADLRGFRANASQNASQANLPTPQNMLEALSDDQLRDLGCSRNNIQRFLQSYGIRATDPEHQFFEMLSIFATIYQRNNVVPGTAQKVVPLLQLLLNEWVAALRAWSMTHEIGHDVLDDLGAIAGDLPREILSDDTRLILMGADDAQVPAGRGIGHRNMSIFSWAELYPSILQFEQTESVAD